MDPALRSDMAHFQIYPLSRFDDRQTKIRRPRQIAHFSFDAGHQSHPYSNESLRYYYPPFFYTPGNPVPRVSLCGGIESWVKSAQDVDGHLDALLETLQIHETSELKRGEDVGHADFITWRGMMTKIMTAAFDDYSDFEMNATCFQDTIYIEQNHAYALQSDQADKARQSNRAPRRPAPEEMQYWGYKFEELATLPKPWAECSREEIEQRDSAVVNNNVQYCSIVQTGIGTSSLIIGGEVDCVMGEMSTDPNAPIPWVELKTSKEIGENQAGREIFERKLCRMWAQSFLLGVPTIIIGFRDEQGNLTRLMELETQKIPTNVATRGERTWNGNVCINFTTEFLDVLKQTIMGTEGVWRIKRGKNSKVISIVKVEQKGTGSIISESFKMHREKVRAVAKTRALAG